MTLSYSETAHICRSLALLLHAGISLADGVYLLAQEETEPHRELLLQLGESMDGGRELSEAMVQSGVFSNQVWGMVQVGEQSGRMEEALNALADYYEERSRTNRQIKNALAYPSLILLLMLAVVAVLLMKVLPVFDDVYASLGGRLTGAGAGLLYLGQALEAMLPGLLAVLVVLAVVGAVYRFRGRFREKVNAFVALRFGDRGIMRKFNNARFAQALAMGLGSGLDLEASIALARQLLADIPAAARRCEECETSLAEGASLSDALRDAKLLPPAQSRMLTVGLRGGNADQVMTDIARQLMQEAREALEDGVARVEPAMVMVSSLLVGVILLAVMLPLVNIMSTIG